MALRDEQERGERVRQAKAVVEVLERQLAEAREDLRTASGGKLRGTSGAKAASKAADRSERERIRAWAAKNGHVLADRGKLPARVVEAYRAAHP